MAARAPRYAVVSFPLPAPRPTGPASDPPSPRPLTARLARARDGVQPQPDPQHDARAGRGQAHPAQVDQHLSVRARERRPACPPCDGPLPLPVPPPTSMHSRPPPRSSPSPPASPSFTTPLTPDCHALPSLMPCPPSFSPQACCAPPARSARPRTRRRSISSAFARVERRRRQNLAAPLGARRLVAQPARPVQALDLDPQPLARPPFPIPFSLSLQTFLARRNGSPSADRSHWRRTRPRCGRPPSQTCATSRRADSPLPCAPPPPPLPRLPVTYDDIHILIANAGASPLLLRWAHCVRPERPARGSSGWARISRPGWATQRGLSS